MLFCWRVTGHFGHKTLRTFRHHWCRSALRQHNRQQCPGVLRHFGTGSRKSRAGHFGPETQFHRWFGLNFVPKFVSGLVPAPILWCRSVLWSKCPAPLLMIDVCFHLSCGEATTTTPCRLWSRPPVIADDRARLLDAAAWPESGPSIKPRNDGYDERQSRRGCRNTSAAAAAASAVFISATARSGTWNWTMFF